jgi:hypothetical protein
VSARRRPTAQAAGGRRGRRPAQTGRRRGRRRRGSPSASQPRTIVIGLLATHDELDLAEDLAEMLPDALRERIGGRFDWRVEIVETEPADASASPSELVESVRRRMLERDWRLGIGLTALPLRAGHLPVATQVSASHGVGIISVPALGAVNRDERLREAALHVVERLLGEAGERAGHEERMRRRSAELADPMGSLAAEDHGTVRFAGSTARGNLRLLVGMIRSNRPTRVMVRLSRAAVAALGTGAYALSSANIWTVAHQSSWVRLVAVGLLSLTLILVALVVRHGLWERAREPAARERVVLFNIVTLTTLTIGVATLYVGLFVLLAVAAAVIIPPAALERQLGEPATVEEFIRLAWLATSVATVGGAFGSLLESHEAVRDAAYRPQAAGEVAP